jgi:hypothetical protein
MASPSTIASKFNLLESEWIKRRKNVINNINIFLSNVGGSSLTLSPELSTFPTGNVNKDQSYNRCEEAWVVLCESIRIFNSILDEMDGIITNAKEKVSGMKLEKAIDRGSSGGASSAIDVIQAYTLKYNMYRNDCLLFETSLQDLSWGGRKLNGDFGDEDNSSGSGSSETSSQPYQSLAILLDSNPCIDTMFIQTIDYHLSLDDQIRRQEKKS